MKQVILFEDSSGLFLHVKGYDFAYKLVNGSDFVTDAEFLLIGNSKGLEQVASVPLNAEWAAARSGGVTFLKYNGRGEWLASDAVKEYVGKEN